MKFFQRANTLAQEDVSLHLEMVGEYKLIERQHLIYVNEGINVTIDGCETGLVDLSGAPTNDERFWLEVMGPGYDGLGSADRILTSLFDPVSINSRGLKLNSAVGISRGDWIAITSTWEYFSGIGNANGYQPVNIGEFSRIRNVNQITGNIYLETGLSFGYKFHSDPASHPVNVRRITVAGIFAAKDLRALGPAIDSSTNRTGTQFLHVRHFEQVQENNVIVENFPGYSIRYTLCGSILLNSPKTIGPKYQLSSSEGVWAYGREIYGCSAGSIVSPIAEHCRRAIDLHEANKDTLAGDALEVEAVIAKNVSMIGGYSISCQSLPGGHYSINTELVGHIGQDAGGQLRGKNVRWVGVHSNRGLGLGIPAGEDQNFLDPDFYPDFDPSQGNVELLGCSFRDQSADGWGVEIRQGIDSLRIDNCTIISSKPISFYGRHQSNIEITNCFLSGPD